MDDCGTGCPMVSLDELLRQSDFVSLHAPLSESTRHLISGPQLARMKPTAWLINTSRGPLIDNLALLDALKANRIGGAALDVFDPEPPDLSDPVYRNERVIVTPHAAFLSEESLREVRTRASRQIADALGGARPENVVNPEVYARTT
jgi:D-3-phosphoglycerate dehydrogenase / 2-oxoglutarate reductase